MTITSKNLQKQEIIEKPKQHTTYTESDDSNEYENEEMSPKVTEGEYINNFWHKECTMPATMSMEAFSDEEVGNDSDQQKSSDQHQCRGFAKRDL